MIEFINDYRGWRTNEKYFVKGQVVSLPAEHEAGLIAEGRAVHIDAPIVPEIQPAVDITPAPPPIEKPKRKRTRRKVVKK